METSTARRDGSEQGAELDAQTLDAFVRAHHRRLTALARLVCLDATEAADAVQAAFEQAWRRRASLRDPDALRPWLDRIVVREAIRGDASSAARGRCRPRWSTVEPATPTR